MHYFTFILKILEKFTRNDNLGSFQVNVNKIALGLIISSNIVKICVMKATNKVADRLFLC